MIAVGRQEPADTIQSAGGLTAPVRSVRGGGPPARFPCLTTRSNPANAHGGRHTAGTRPAGSVPRFDTVGQPFGSDARSAGIRRGGRTHVVSALGAQSRGRIGRCRPPAFHLDEPRFTRRGPVAGTIRMDHDVTKRGLRMTALPLDASSGTSRSAPRSEQRRC